MKPFNIHSITLKLILLFILVILVPTITTTLTTMRVMTSREERELDQHAKTGLNRAKTLLVQLLSRAENIARLLAGINDIKEQMPFAEFERYFADILLPSLLDQPWPSMKKIPKIVRAIRHLAGEYITTTNDD